MTKIPAITAETFAKWSFERDRSVGLYHRNSTYSSVGREEKALYIEEAEYYLSKPREHWPVDILDRLKKEENEKALSATP